jgi:succinate dehydrogenase assembly factor 2
MFRLLAAARSPSVVAPLRSRAVAAGCGVRAFGCSAPTHVEKIIDPELNMPPPTPLDRSGETIETTRKRLVYQSRKRGMLENDLLLSTFADKYLKTLNEEELHQYDSLLDENDWDIYYWVTGKKPVPEKFNHSVMQKLKEYSRNERKHMLRMPELSVE